MLKLSIDGGCLRQVSHVDVQHHNFAIAKKQTNNKNIRELPLHLGTSAFHDPFIWHTKVLSNSRPSIPSTLKPSAHRNMHLELNGIYSITHSGRTTVAYLMVGSLGQRISTKGELPYARYSGIWENFACGIRNTARGISNPTNNYNPSFNDKYWNQEPITWSEQFPCTRVTTFSRHCWANNVESCCVGLYVSRLDWFQTLCRNMQQGVQTRKQHVTSNDVGSCWPTMYGANIRHVHISHNTPCFPPKILHKHCPQFPFRRLYYP